jgi:hypothetical protein
MLHYGRRPVFLAAAMLGLLGGLLQLLSLYHGGYGLIVFGAVVQVGSPSRGTNWTGTWQRATLASGPPP